MDNAAKKFQLGKVVFTISGKSPAAKYFMEEFQPVAYSGEIKPQLSIQFVDSLPWLEPEVKTSTLAAAVNAIRYDTAAFSQLFIEHDGDYSLYIEPHPIKWIKEILPELLVRLREPSHLPPHQALAKAVLYDAFDYVFQNLQLQFDQTFIHASSVSKSDQALLFPAWGGVGKTTSLLKLMKHKHYEFLSDDLAIMDSAGQVYQNPKKIQVYAYNMLGEPWLQDAALTGRSRTDLLAWQFRLKRFGPQGVRRRMYAGELFDHQLVAKQASVSQVFYLERSSTDEFETVSLSAGSLAEKVAYVLPHELSPYTEIASFYKSSFPNGRLLFGPDEMIEQVRRVVKSAVTTRAITLLKIPLSAKPEDIYSKLTSLLDNS
jgi:hypothetical protein